MAPATTIAQARESPTHTIPDPVRALLTGTFRPFISCGEPKVPANLFRWNDAKITQQDCVTEEVPNERTVVLMFENKVLLPCGVTGIVRAPVAFSFTHFRDSADAARNYYRPYMTLFDSSGSETGILSQVWRYEPIPEPVSLGKKLQAVKSFLKLKDNKERAFPSEYLAQACVQPIR